MSAAQDDDDVFDVLEEAQALMQEMGDGDADLDEEGVDSIVIDGFSIDDVFDEPPIIDARTFPVSASSSTSGSASTPASTPITKVEVAIGQDPLSIVTSSANANSSASSGAAYDSQSPLRRTSASFTVHPLTDEQVLPAKATTLNAPSLADVKARASGFATSISSFAQKAAHAAVAAASDIDRQVSQMSAAATTHAVTTSTTSSAPQQTFQQQPNAYPLVAPPAHPHAIELDNDQKNALIQEHLGTLLPGERVIMFLSNLLHVSDSSGWELNNISTRTNNSTSTPTREGMWCCCMTFYRVVLFHTASSINSSINNSTSNYNTNFSPPPPLDWDPDCWPTPPQPIMLQMPLASVDRVEKSIYSTSQNTTLMGLIMHGKDNGRQLRFTTPSYADTLRVHESIQTYAFPGRRNLGYLFAFESKRAQVMDSIEVDAETGKKAITLPPAPRRFDAIQEFTRQFGSLQPCPWTLYTQINATYQLSMSYPSVLCGPSSLPEASQDTQRILRQCAGFRSEQRIVALTWSSGVDGASLWRSAQPKVGLQGNRNQSDEFFLRQIAESAASSNSLRLDAPPKPSREWIQKLTGQPDMGLAVDPGCSLKIMDMRPRASALANRTSGYGYENTSHYTGTTLQFCNISNIHSVRDSYTKMSALCMSATAQDQNWNSLIEDTRWLHLIRTIWAAAWEAAFWIHVHRLPVLLHCSHGWDRTSQVAVLSQLLLDPYYRTRAGFAALVEKDFLSFGHPFHTRCAHGEGRGSDNPSSSGTDEGQISPIFLQFLDCVYQLINLFPEKFEFNEKYLLVFSEHVYSCRFGTLLCDTERERELVAGIRQRTHSVWDYLESRPDCINPSYQPSSKVLLMPLPTLMRSISLWTNRHAMYGPKVTSRCAYQPLDVVPAKGEIVETSNDKKDNDTAGATTTDPASLTTTPQTTTTSTPAVE